MGGEEADRVVAPVVGQPARGDLRLGDEVVHRQQLDRGHAEVGQVVDDGRAGEAGVRPAQLLGHPVVQLGHPLDVQLVDHGVAPPTSCGALFAPVEPVVDDHAERHLARRVEDVGRLRSAGRVAEDRRVGHQPAADGSRVRIEQQLLHVEPQALLGSPRAVDPVAVALAGPDAGHRAVPDAERALRQPVPGLDAVVVDEAEVRRRGLGRPDREVGRLLRPRGAEVAVGARPDGRDLPSGPP